MQRRLAALLAIASRRGARPPRARRARRTAASVPLERGLRTAAAIDGGTRGLALAALARPATASGSPRVRAAGTRRVGSRTSPGATGATSAPCRRAGWRWSIRAARSRRSAGVGRSIGSCAPRIGGIDPAREAAVRQRRQNGAPVPETACRVPGGDVVQRVYGATLGGALGDAVVIEVENTTAVPVAVAFAVRPVDLLGAGSDHDDRARRHARPARRSARARLRAPARARRVRRRDLRLPRMRHVGWRRRRARRRRCVIDGSRQRHVRRAGAAPDTRSASLLPAPRRSARSADDRRHAARGRRRSCAGGTRTVSGARIELPDERVSAIYAAAVRNLLLASGNGAVRGAVTVERTGGRVADEVRIVRALHLRPA